MKVTIGAGGVAVLVGGVLVVGVAWLAARKLQAVGGAAANAGAAAWNAAAGAAWAINPANNSNVIYGTANRAFGAVTGNEVDTIGTWLYGLLNPEPDPVVDHGSSWATGMGRWNNPSAYGADNSGSATPGTTGAGGAAFGIYPRAW